MANTYANRLRTRLVLQQPTGLWTNSFAYDAARRLTNVTSPSGAFGYAYDALRSTLPTLLTLPNTSYVTNRYDVNARLLYTKLDNSSGTTLDAAEYGYNMGNQRTTFTNATGTFVDYTFDLIGQLEIAASSVSSENRGYLYDAAWNLNHRTNNGVSTTFSVNGLNELTAEGGISCSYDADGNLINQTGTRNGTNYSYDSEDRLVLMQYAANGTISNATSFVYDGLGRLREQLQWTTNYGSTGQGPLINGNGSWTLVGGILYVYDGNRVIQERDTNGNPTTSYTRGNDLSGSLEGAGGIGGMLARTMGYSSSTGNWSTNDYYHADGNGNITYLVDSSQGLAASYRYDPFGNMLSSSGPLVGINTYQFSSKEYIPTAGFYYYLYRFYDAGLQRWINRDPIQERGGINIYRFTLNDPVGLVDTKGLYVPLPKAPPIVFPPVIAPIVCAYVVGGICACAIDVASCIIWPNPSPDPLPMPKRPPKLHQPKCNDLETETCWPKTGSPSYACDFECPSGARHLVQPGPNGCPDTMNFPLPAPSW